MKKSEILAALGAINNDEIVLLRSSDGTMHVIADIEIQQDEPPIFGVIVTADINDAEFRQIATERQAVKDAEAARLADIAEQERVTVEEAEKAQADKAAAFTDAVAAEVAKQLAAKK